MTRRGAVTTMDSRPDAFVYVYKMVYRALIFSFMLTVQECFNHHTYDVLSLCKFVPSLASAILTRKILFYEGVVKSYDQKKNKHVIKYNDGDVEVLCLDKERWELVDDGRKTLKRLNLPKKMPAKGLSVEQRKKSSCGSRQSKKQINICPSSQVKGKRAPRKNLKHGHKRISKSFTEFCQEGSDQSPRISDPEPATTFKVEDFETEEEQSDRMEESLGGENSDKHEKSVSEGHQVEDAGSSSNEMEESKEEDPEAVEEDIKNAAGTFNTAKGSDEEDVSSSEETQKRALSREDSDDVADEVGKSHLQVNQADDADGYPPSSHESDRITSAAFDPENSDDEPLGVWKRRAGKLVEGK